jgi:catechol 2,3-dioxygenase
MSQANAPSIAPATGVRTVHLDVTDGPRAQAFYEQVVGLRRIGGGDEIRLGAAGREVVVLHPGASGPVVPHRSGLYHLALVVPSRRDLAVVIRRLIVLRYPNAPTDHVLTKADYLRDLDGNGIEVYAETPEDGTWFFDDRRGFAARDRSGQPRSGRDPIDLEELLGHLDATDEVEQPMPAGTKMGHVHLHVSHLGDAGLRRFTVELPAERDLEAVVARLRAGGVDVEQATAGYEVRDPSQNLVRLITRGD